MNKLDPRNIYDDLHQIPELGFEEFKTSAYLADKKETLLHMPLYDLYFHQLQKHLNPPHIKNSY